MATLPTGGRSTGDSDALAVSPETDNALRPIVDEIIDDLAMEVIFSSHMEAKMGVLFLHEELLADEHSGGRVASRVVGGLGAGLIGGERSSSDSEPPMFGQPAAKLKPVMCRCPNCNRSMAALRFAPHLEKCMGMGRVSSRVASRRIAIQHRYSDDSDSDEQHHHHHPPPMKQRRSMKRSSTAPGNVAAQRHQHQPPPPPPPPQFHDPIVSSSAAGGGAGGGGGGGDDDWDGLSTPSPSSASTGSSGGNSGGGGGNTCLARTALHNHHIQQQSSSRR